MSRSEVIARFPGVKKEGLTGAAVFHDGQMYNPARLVLSFLKSAVLKGAVAANYIEAERLLKEGNRVAGCSVRDVLTDERFDVRARVTVNAAGPWADAVLAAAVGLKMWTTMSAKSNRTQPDSAVWVDKTHL